MIDLANLGNADAKKGYVYLNHSYLHALIGLCGLVWHSQNQKVAAEVGLEERGGRNLS